MSIRIAYGKRLQLQINTLNTRGVLSALPAFAGGRAQDQQFYVLFEARS